MIEGNKKSWKKKLRARGREGGWVILYLRRSLGLRPERDEKACIHGEGGRVRRGLRRQGLGRGGDRWIHQVKLKTRMEIKRSFDPALTGPFPRLLSSITPSAASACQMIVFNALRPSFRLVHGNETPPTCPNLFFLICLLPFYQTLLLLLLLLLLLFRFTDSFIRSCYVMYRI